VWGEVISPCFVPAAAFSGRGFPDHLAIAMPKFNGYIIILVFYKETVLLRIVALISLVVLLVLLHDMTSLIRLVVSRKYSIFFNKSEAKNFMARMREGEITYKLWNKFKLKLKRK
jgi:uncharacterized membrane protein